MAIEPSFVAGTDERAPRNPPIGVRATPTMQTSVHNKLKRSTKTTPAMQTCVRNKLKRSTKTKAYCESRY